MRDGDETPESDEQLVAKVAEGNAAALRTLYERLGAAVYALSLRSCAAPADAEDLTQEVFVEIWNRAARFDADRASVRAWVMTVARSRAIDRARRRALEERSASDADHVPLEHESHAAFFEKRQHAQLLALALQTLPPAQRDAIGLTYLEGMTTVEAARTLGCPVGTVKTRVRLGLRRLPGLLGFDHNG